MPPSASSSRSPRSSATPPPVISEKQKTKPKAREKGKEKASNQTNQAFEPRNEGVDPNWAYKPPPGAVLVENKNVEAGDFDWDAINDDDDLELCLIRVPDAIKPKHIQNLPISSTSATQNALVGTLKRKTATFDLWSISSADDPRAPIGGEEIKSISCLLPRKRKKGRLYPAPKPIAHHFVLAAQAVLPTPPETDGENNTNAVEYTNTPRHSYPTHVLKHRYMPTGSLVKREGEYEVVDVDQPKEDKEADVDVEMEGLATEDDAKPTPAVEEASTSHSNKPPSIRRKEKKTKGVNEEAVVNESEVETKETKKKGRKRKGDTMAEPDEVGESAMPSKRAKRMRPS